MGTLHVYRLSLIYIYRFKITVNIINVFKNLKIFYTLDIHFLAEINNEWETIGTALDVQLSVLCGLQHSNVDNRVKRIRVIRSSLDTMSTETTWNVIIKIIEGPIVNHCTTGIKIRKFFAEQYNVTWVDYI